MDVLLFLIVDKKNTYEILSTENIVFDHLTIYTCSSTLLIKIIGNEFR